MRDIEVVHGDAVEVLDVLADDGLQVDAIVTDPPYALPGGFMGQAWDRFEPRAFQAWCQQWAERACRVLKPGGYLLALGGTRTAHRLVSGVEDAGFEIRDTIAWLYGSGFPKSLDVGKAIDRMHGAKREIVGTSPYAAVRGGNAAGIHKRNASSFDREDRGLDVTTPATEDAARWDGWGTALKPAHEPIVVARKPLAGTVAGNVLAHGTGALNIDASRIPSEPIHTTQNTALGRMNDDGWEPKPAEFESHPAGRWPANVTLDQAAADQLDRTVGERPRGRFPGNQNKEPGNGRTMGDGWTGAVAAERDLDAGGPSRFFYTAKASSADRGPGNTHPTVKPVDLMRWLVRLVTTDGALVLDPFAGSGTTGVACAAERRRALLIEQHGPYVDLIRQRLARPIERALFDL